jgi:short-subunit dehydrogenase
MNQKNNANAENVVITGAGAGVGRAVVEQFVKHMGKQKANIALISRDKDRLRAAQREVEEAGGRAIMCPLDVADPRQVESAADTVERELGPIDIWINVAMTTVFAPFWEITPEEFERATKVTYLGFVYGTMAALKRMRARDHGTIVQVGSALAYRSIPYQSVYCGAKHAMVGFTDSIRSELIHDRSRVHITAVHLPAMNTPQFSWCRSKLPRHPQPVPPIFEPEVAAKAIYYAAHHRRREIYVGFSTVKAIYGQKIAAGFADRYLGKTGYDAQQTEQEISPDRPDNLFKPVHADFGARGVFTGRAKDFSPQVWSDLHLGTVLAVGAGLSALAYAAVRGIRESH